MICSSAVDTAAGYDELRLIERVMESLFSLSLLF